MTSPHIMFSLGPGAVFLGSAAGRGDDGAADVVCYICEAVVDRAAVLRCWLGFKIP